MDDRTPFRLLVAALLLLPACGRTAPDAGTVAALYTDGLEPVPIESPLPWPTLRWPASLLVEREDRFLWAEGSELFRIELTADGVDVTPWSEQSLVDGLDRIVGAAQAPDGTVAVFDASGRVAGSTPVSGQGWGFGTALRNRAAKLAVSDGRVYFLLTGESEGGRAVVAYRFGGGEAGRWGRMDAAGVIQQSLSGGGIAACPDGSIYYSYINSPRIHRLEPGTDGAIQSLGEAGHGSFRVVSERRIRRALEESLRTRDVAPLVELGLGASRVMGLFCSEGGMLFRQVARPGGTGSYVEVWDPRSGVRVGAVPAAGAVLLGVDERTLYLGRVSEERIFNLERIRYRIEPGRPGRVS